MPAAPAGAARRRFGTIQGRRPRVLVADDNAFNLMILKKILDATGDFDTIMVHDGKQAMELVASRPFDVVLMDVEMPGLSGIDATIAIRKSGGPQPPIIAVTAHAQAEEAERCRAAGMQLVLVKPVDQKHLYDALKVVLPQMERELTNSN